MYKSCEGEGREVENKKPWPKNCPWPEPEDTSGYYGEDSVIGIHDEGVRDLIKIKDYFDSLVDKGMLNEDYSLDEDYEWGEDEFIPAMGHGYWHDGFDDASWRDDLSHSIGLLRFAPMDPYKDPTVGIRNTINYSFNNENLLRQAFTRRAFAIEYGLSGSSEELEFLGDTVLSTIVTKELFAEFTENSPFYFDAPFQSEYNEGEFTKIKDQFVSKEALSARARELGLGKYILYGTGEKETDSALEDMMEALIGAVVIDSKWDMGTVEQFVNELIAIQFKCVDSFLKKSYYEILNSWHQRHFGVMPEYKVYERMQKSGINHYYPYVCDIKFQVPENDKGVFIIQQLTYDGRTKSKAREHAAERAYNFIVRKGLWQNLAAAKIVPDFENSINQLQELYQKKYIETAPEYEYDDQFNCWYVTCTADSFKGWGKADTKMKAKKKAAFSTIVLMLISAGICKDEWQDEMFRMI